MRTGRAEHRRYSLNNIKSVQHSDCNRAVLNIHTNTYSRAQYRKMNIAISGRLMFSSNFFVLLYFCLEFYRVIWFAARRCEPSNSQCAHTIFKCFGQKLLRWQCVCYFSVGTRNSSGVVLHRRYLIGKTIDEVSMCGVRMSDSQQRRSGWWRNAVCELARKCSLDCTLSVQVSQSVQFCGASIVSNAFVRVINRVILLRDNLRCARMGQPFREFQRYECHPCMTGTLRTFCPKNYESPRRKQFQL